MQPAEIIAQDLDILGGTPVCSEEPVFHSRRFSIISKAARR